VRAGSCELAVLDSYELDSRAICELARSTAVLTIAEANRCAQAGLVLDYHLDRAEDHDEDCLEDRDGALLGPRFAPLDPAFFAAARRGAEVRAVLVTTGGSRRARELLGPLAAAAAAEFPGAEILIAGGGIPIAGGESETGGDGPLDALRRDLGADSFLRFLPVRASLLDALPHTDLAIGGAGLSAYELACAGAPLLALALSADQRRVLEGLRKRDLAVCLDLTGGDSLADVPAALRRLRDRATRERLARHGMRTFDGGGAGRAAIALTGLFA